MCHSIDHQLFDFPLQFAGPALLGVSIWQYIKLMSYDPVLEISKFEIPVIIYITAGIASTFNGIIGCVGGVNGRKGAILLVTHQKKIVSIMIKQRLMFIAFKSPNEWRSLGNAWLFPSFHLVFAVSVFPRGDFWRRGVCQRGIV